MAGWRDRIDRTTNWAITVVAAMLSISLSTPSAHHGVLLFAMVLVLLLLVIEARRYRFFDVYRERVRRSSGTISPRSSRRRRGRPTIGCRCWEAISGSPSSVSPTGRPSRAACAAIIAGCS